MSAALLSVRVGSACNVNVTRSARFSSAGFGSCNARFQKKYRVIHHHLTGPMTASCLECPTLRSRPLCIAASVGVYRIRRTIPVAGVTTAVELYTSSNKHTAIHINKNE